MVSKIYREKNPEDIKEYNKKYYSEHSENSKRRYSEWVKNNYNYRVSYIKKWKDENSENIRNYYRYKYHSDKIYKLITNVRGRINQFLKTKKIMKKNKTFEMVGCKPEFLREYIEKKFTIGMSWDIMGKEIHIDHIIPLSSAKTEDEVLKLCHYTNLQPLWAKDNLKKSNKILIS